MSNPLVATAQSDTTAVTGIGIAESSMDLANGISNGDWVEGGLGAVGVGLEVLSMVIDPIGTIASYGVSWLIEHVQPLKEALDWFAGDPPVIRSFSETWANVAAEVIAKLGKLGRKGDAPSSTSPSSAKASDGTSPSSTTSPSSSTPDTGNQPPARTGDGTGSPQDSTSPQSASDLYRKPRGGGNDPQPFPPERRDPRFEYWPDTGQLKRTPENIRKVMEKYGIKLDPGARPRPDSNLQGAHGKPRSMAGTESCE